MLLLLVPPPGEGFPMDFPPYPPLLRCWNNTENRALIIASVLSVLVLKVELAGIEPASKQGI